MNLNSGAAFRRCRETLCYKAVVYGFSMKVTQDG